VGGRIIPFAQDGIVDSPTIAPMALFGEAGPEAIVPLKRGADRKRLLAYQHLRSVSLSVIKCIATVCDVA
jgi:hypothetical protein